MSGGNAFQVGMGVFNGIGAITLHDQHPLVSIVLSIVSAFGIGIALWRTAK